MKNAIPAFVCLLLSLNVSAQLSADGFPKIDPKNVTIVRDSFGIPHIFGKTDAEVAYGLAWANAEDAFHITQDLIYTGKGYMGRYKGIDGAKNDFFVHAIGARELVEKKFDTDLSPEFKKYIDGFVQGINAYAAAHPDEVAVKKAFPLTSRDIVTSYVVIMSALTYSQNQIGDAVGGKFDNTSLEFPKHAAPSVGSNAFALNASKMEDGKTFICINPHMGFDGQLSFYEAHLQSEEGLNIEGCMFQGSSSLAMGVNQHLGWGMTWNSFDKLDVFKLKMNPKKKLEYEFDGNWVKLEKKPVWLKVNLAKKGKFVLPVKKMTYWSKYGATVKSGESENYYSIRFPANTTIRTGEQLYKMNKARNYKEYWDAIRIHAITLFNIVYADKDDNIFYLNHGMFPDRDTTYDWSGLVAGNTSKTLWTKLIPLDSMTRQVNPACGYVYNTNNSPLHNTSPECVDGHCVTARRLIDQRPGDNNRATRFQELISAKNKFTWNDLHALKFDMKLSDKSPLAKCTAPFFNLDENKYPDLKEAIGVLKSWSRVFDIHEHAPTLFGLVIKDVFEKHDFDDANFVLGFDAPEQEWAEALRKACDTLKAHYGTVKVEWGTVHRNIRGNVDLPLRGFADMLSPTYPKLVKGGKLRFKPHYGDTYTMMAEFNKNGVQRLEALQPAGNSLRTDDKHYNDQIELFSRQALRPLSLKKEDVMKKAERVYNPGP